MTSSPWEGFSLDPRARRNAAMRASDADRDHAATLIGNAYAEGRLTAGEHEERLSAAMSAERMGELAPLLADLGLGATAPLPATRQTDLTPAASRTAGLSLLLGAAAVATGMTLFMGSFGLVGWVFVLLLLPRVLELVRGGGHPRGHGGTNQLPRPDRDA